MRNIILRPLFSGCAVFLIFSCLMYDTPVRFMAYTICLSLAALAASLLIFRRRRHLLRLTASVFLSLAIASAVSANAFGVRLAKASELDGKTVSVTAVIEEVIYCNNHYGRYTARLTGTDGLEIKASLELDDGSCSTGDVMCGTVTLHALSSGRGYNELTMNLPEGIMLTAEGVSMTYAGDCEITSLKSRLSSIGSRISGIIKSRSYGGMPLTRAVLIGDKSDLDGTLERDFTRLGVSHTVAISGMHLSVIAAILERVLNRTALRRRGRIAVMISSILLFMGITGFTSSVLRAGAMHIIRSLGSLSGRRGDSYTSLAAAASLIVLLSPFSVLDAGFLLSVIAAFACIVYSELSRRRKRRSFSSSVKAFAYKGLLYIADTALMTTLICFATMPVMWKYFGEVSLLSPLSNMIFIPLTTLLLYCGIILLIASPVRSAALALSVPFALLENITSEIAARLSSLRGITVSVNYPGVIGLSVMITGLLVAAPLLRGKAHRISAFFALLTSLCLVLTVKTATDRASASEELLYKPTGKNDVLLMRKGLSCAVVDVTDGSSWHLKGMIPEVRETGCTEIESIVLTHLHKRHLASLVAVSRKITVREVLLPEPENEDELFLCDSIVRSLRELRVAVRFYPRCDGRSFTTSDTRFSVFDYTLLSRSTHPVVGIEFDLCGERILYVGESGNEGSEGLLSSAFNADLVLFGGHSPVYEKDTVLPVGGDRAVSPGTRWDGLSASPVGGVTYYIEEGGEYRIIMSHGK